MANRNWTSIQITPKKSNVVNEDTLNEVLEDSVIEDALEDCITLNGKYSFPKEDVERIHKKLIQKDEDLEMTVTCECETYDYIVGGYGCKTGILFEIKWPGNEEYEEALEDGNEEQYEEEMQEWQMRLIDDCKKKLKDEN